MKNLFSTSRLMILGIAAIIAIGFTSCAPGYYAHNDGYYDNYYGGRYYPGGYGAITRDTMGPMAVIITPEQECITTGIITGMTGTLTVAL